MASKKNKRSNESRRPRRRLKLPVSRLYVGLGVLAALLVLLFVYRAAYFNTAAASSIAKRDFAAAAKSLGWAEFFARNDGRTHFLQARLARLQGRMSDVQDRLSQAYEAGYDKEIIQREQWLAMAQQGQLEEATRQLKVLLLDPRGDEPEICNAYAIGYVRMRNFDAARKLLVGWSKDFPKDPRPLYLQGVVQKDLQMHKEAEQAFRAALKADPKHYDSAFELGSVLLTRKRPTEAMEYFRFAVKSRDYGTSARVAEAHCQRLLDGGDEARKILEDILSEQPDHEEASLEISRLDLDSNDYQPIVDRLTPHVEKNPRNTDMRLILAQALRGVGQIAKAESHLTAVAEMNANLVKANQLAEKVGGADIDKNADLRCQIGKIHLKYGAPKEGLLWLMQAFNSNPKHQPTLEALIQFYDQKGIADRANFFRQRLSQAKEPTQ